MAQRIDNNTRLQAAMALVSSIALPVVERIAGSVLLGPQPPLRMLIFGALIGSVMCIATLALLVSTSINLLGCSVIMFASGVAISWLIYEAGYSIPMFLDSDAPKEGSQIVDAIYWRGAYYLALWFVGGIFLACLSNVLVPRTEKGLEAKSE